MLCDKVNSEGVRYLIPLKYHTGLLKGCLRRKDLREAEVGIVS